MIKKLISFVLFCSFFVAQASDIFRRRIAEIAAARVVQNEKLEQSFKNFQAADYEFCRAFNVGNSILSNYSGHNQSGNTSVELNVSPIRANSSDPFVSVDEGTASEQQESVREFMKKMRPNAQAIVDTACDITQQSTSDGIVRFSDDVKPMSQGSLFSPTAGSISLGAAQALYAQDSSSSFGFRNSSDLCSGSERFDELTRYRQIQENMIDFSEFAWPKIKSFIGSLPDLVKSRIKVAKSAATIDAAAQTEVVPEALKKDLNLQIQVTAENVVSVDQASYSHVAVGAAIGVLFAVGLYAAYRYQWFDRCKNWALAKKKACKKFFAQNHEKNLNEKNDSDQENIMQACP